MIRRVLVANRGEIACRIFRTCERLGLERLAVYSDADEKARHVAMADRAFRLGPAPATESYLRADLVLEAARALGADAVHPGYGFLSEDAQFARAVVDAGLTWIGPSPESMTAMADKLQARRAVAALGVPIVPGVEEPVGDVEEALRVAADIGYPVIAKAAAGGGGIGMQVAHDADELARTFESTRVRCERSFGASALYLERYVRSARHVEVQVVGLPDGTVLALGDRDCSVQRRHQKVVEEAPCPVLTDAERALLHDLGARIAAGVDYRNVGTVEMLFDLDSRELYFLEMNTRLQVEHPITEMVTGLDLVELQLAIAQGIDPGIDAPVPQRGHAFEFRVYAEDPKRFLPGPGVIAEWAEPEGEGIRVDSGYRAGDEVTAFYDPMMAKLCAWGPDREAALARLVDAASGFRIEGPRQNLPLLERLAADRAFRDGEYDTRILERPAP